MALTNIEKTKLEKLFAMNSGYVLDFSNRGFGEFITSATKKDIWSESYNQGSGSKANRLRAFWQIESDSIVGKLLLELVEYWNTKKQMNNEVISSSEQVLFNDCKKAATRLIKGNSPNSVSDNEMEEDFINREFKSISLTKLNLDNVTVAVITQRIEEIKKCLSIKASLSVIFLCGSTLEGILLNIATKYPQKFNEAVGCPKKENKPLPFPQWTLSSLIDVAYELRILQEDVKRHSHALRDFRNYIHPYQQALSGFTPHEHTAKISWQVLQAAIFEISNYSS